MYRTVGYRRSPLALALWLAVSAPSAPATATETVVTIENFTFKPATVTVHAGSKVTFKNVDDIPHSIVLSDGSFHSKALDTGDMATMTFAKAGDFGYFCGLHPHMQGKVTVLP